MGRVVGYHGKNILFVSDVECKSSSIDCLNVPSELASVSSDELMHNYVVWNGKIVHSAATLPAKELKVAFISNYNVSCGIATYSKWLYDSMTPLLGDYVIFAEHANEPTPPDAPNVVRCWRRGESMGELVRRIHEYKPDIVLIQHEYGLFPDARHWLSLMSQLNRYRVIVTLHSVYKSHYDKMICELAIPEMVVHTNVAASMIKDAHLVPGKVHIIPHGCPVPQPTPKVWNMYRSDHTFIQFGFGFRYKGWEQSLEVTAKLKEKYPDVFFTGLFSESPFSRHLHNVYYAELEEKIIKLGIQDNVGMIRGFVPEDLLMTALKMSKAAIFPYIENGEHTVYGCSGAARIAMRACLPVLISPAPLFDDLEGVIPRLADVDGFCNELSSLFESRKRREEAVARQSEFMKANSWDNVAAKYVNIFTNPL